MTADLHAAVDVLAKQLELESQFKVGVLAPGAKKLVARNGMLHAAAHHRAILDPEHLKIALPAGETPAVEKGLETPLRLRHPALRRAGIRGVLSQNCAGDRWKETQADSHRQYPPQKRPLCEVCLHGVELS